MDQQGMLSSGVAMARGVALTVTLVLLVTNLSGSAAVDHDPCRTPSLTPGKVGSRGNITSTNYPDAMPPKSPQDHNCRMQVRACPECRIHLTYTEFTAPPCNTRNIPLGSCVLGCDHLLIYEPYYPEETTQYVFGDSTLSTFTSVSNRVTIVVCHTISNDKAMRRFKLGYEIQEKRRVIRGRVGGPNQVGYFTSPNFPHRYSLHDEVFHYLLENDDPNGLVRLGFDDWNLSPNSRLTIYFHNTTHPDGYLTRMGRGERPFVLSSGPSLFIRFETGEDLYAIPYIGFKASYEFVSEPSWPDKPYTVHDEYFYSRYGGQFSFNTQRCWPGDRVDCIWVVTKYNDHSHDQVALTVQSFFVQPGEDYLEIRSGNSSEGLLLGQYEHSNLTGTQFVSKHGFYLRLRATCSNTRTFHAVFASFANATQDGCTHYYHFQCANNRCIAKSLVCDGIDHCGDGTDEIGCTTPNPSTRKECITTYVCGNGMGWYCLSDRCNGQSDCEDSTDELNCWNTVNPNTDPPFLDSYYRLGTYIPVGLVAVLLAIIACIVISCCARRKRNLMRRRQHALQSGRGLPSISASLPGRGRRLRSASETHLNINVEIQHYPDSPPPYEEAISQSQSTYSGIHNMAFSMSDSNDHLMTPPPPYSPRDENPYPPAQLAARGLYIPNPSGGVLIGMPPPTGQYSPPPEADSPPPPQVALTGAGDLAGSVDLAAVHGGGNGANRRGTRDQGRRRGRQQRQGATGSRSPATMAYHGVPAVNNNNGGQTAPNQRDSRSSGTGGRGGNGGQRGRRGQDTSGERTWFGRRSDPSSSSSPPCRPPPPPRRQGSESNSPIQNFVQNLIGRAARQATTTTTTPSTPPTLPSSDRQVGQLEDTVQAPPGGSARDNQGVGADVPPPPQASPRRQVSSATKDNGGNSAQGRKDDCVEMLRSTVDKLLTEDKPTSGDEGEPVPVPVPAAAAPAADSGSSIVPSPTSANPAPADPKPGDKGLKLDGADDSMTFV